MANETANFDRKAVWGQVIAKIHPQVDRGHLLTIFIHSAILSYEKGVLVIGFASIIGPDYVREKYHGKIFQMLLKLFLRKGSNMTLNIFYRQMSAAHRIFFHRYLINMKFDRLYQY